MKNLKVKKWQNFQHLPYFDKKVVVDKSTSRPERVLRYGGQQPLIYSKTASNAFPLNLHCFGSTQVRNYAGLKCLSDY